MLCHNLFAFAPNCIALFHTNFYINLYHNYTQKTHTKHTENIILHPFITPKKYISFFSLFFQNYHLRKLCRWEKDLTILSSIFLPSIYLNHSFHIKNFLSLFNQKKFCFEIIFVSLILRSPFFEIHLMHQIIMLYVLF